MTDITVEVTPAVQAAVHVTRPPATMLAEIVVAGQRGEKGDPGVATYIHVQDILSALWVINHNLGIQPMISVLTVGGVEVEAQIVHISVNQAQVVLASPMRGSARCL